MIWPDRIPIANAFDVVPHPVAIDDACSRRLTRAEHPTVDVIRNAGQHPFWWRTESCRPVGAHEIVISADSARGHDHGLRVYREFSGRATQAGESARHVARLEHVPAHTGRDSALDHDLGHAAPELKRDQAATFRVAHTLDEGLEHSGAGSPNDMKAGNGVPVLQRRVAAAFRPAHDRKESDPQRAEPGTLFTGGPGHVRLRPATRPVVFGPVEAGGSEPVLHRELVRIANAETPLLRRVYEKQSAERPEGLTAKRRLRFLLEDHNPATGVRELGRRDEAGQSGPHDDDVRLVGRFGEPNVFAHRAVETHIGKTTIVTEDRLRDSENQTRTASRDDAAPQACR